MQKFLLVHLFSLFVNLFLAGQSPELANNLSILEKYANETRPEKLFIHTDKEAYIAGDTIWYKVYLTDAISHKASLASNVIYVELFSAEDSLITRQKLFTKDGSAYGDLPVDINLNAGLYHLRGYSLYQLNFDMELFSKELKIWDPLSDTGLSVELDVDSSKGKMIPAKPSLRMFPEGGNLINGIMSKLAFKIENLEADPEDYKVELKDSYGNVISNAKIYEQGLGALSFKPEKAKSYILYLYRGKEYYTYDILEVEDRGYVMNINPRGNKIVISISHNFEKEAPAYMIAHKGGKVLWVENLTFTDNKYVSILRTDSLNSGVIHFTLFDKNDIPRAERLVFINNLKSKILISSEDSVYVVQEKIKTTIEVENDSSGSLGYIDCSLSVYNIAADSILSPVEDIRSYLLMNSDLRGPIENPEFYLGEPGDIKKQYLLDLLMMTHGWRRFRWDKPLEMQFPDSIKYPHEKGLMIRGYTGGTLKLKNRVPARVLLTTMDGVYYEQEIQTNEEGEFTFGPFESYNTIQVFLQARRLKENKEHEKLEGSRNLMIYRYEDTYPEFHSPLIERIPKIRPSPILNNFLEESRTAAYKHQQYLNLLKVDLDELTITGRAKTLEDSLNEIQRKLSYYGRPSSRVILDDRDRQGAMTVFDLLRQVPGVQIVGTRPNQNARIRGVSSINASLTPLYLVDGMEVDASYLNNMNTSDIIFIDVIKDGRAAIFGSRGGNGAIAIYTGNISSDDSRKPGIINFELYGFHPPTEFYSARRAYEFRKEGLTDDRSTLYWQPNLTLKPGDKNKIDFFSSDLSGRYKIVLQGLSDRGEPVYAERMFSVGVD